MSAPLVPKQLPFGLSLKHSLHSHSLFYLLIKDVAEIIVNQIPQLNKLRTNQELLLLVCRCVRIKNSKITNLDESEIVISIYCEIFEDFSEEEITTLRGNIKFLEDNKKITGVSAWKTCTAAIKDWISRRIL